MPTVSCIPLILHPQSKIGFRSCEVIPGVKLQRIDKPLKKYFDTFSDKLPREINLNFAPSHVILIEMKRYIDELEKRIEKEGQRLPELPRDGVSDHFDRSVFLTDGEAITRHLIVSLVLLGLPGFQVAGTYGLEIQGSGAKKKIGGGGYSRLPSRGNYWTHNYFLMPTPLSPIQGRTLKQMAAKLELYYCSGTWWEDRLSRAFGHFWNALCSPFPDQLFIGLATTIEAALSTDKLEITHQIAERVAMVVERDPEERYEKYELMKKLYANRSKLVHGSADFNKRLTMESLAVYGRGAFVPHTDSTKLMSLTIAILNALLRDQEYLQIIRNKKKDGKLNVEVRELFTRRLLGRRSGSFRSVQVETSRGGNLFQVFFGKTVSLARGSASKATPDHD